MKQRERYEELCEKLYSLNLTPQEKAVFVCEMHWGSISDGFNEVIESVGEEIYDEDEEEENDMLDDFSHEVNALVKEKMDEVVDKVISDE